MSAVTTLLSLIDTTLKADAGLGNSRVFRGQKYFREAETSLEKTVRALTNQAEGVFAFWKGPRTIQDRTKPGQLIVYGELYLPRAKATTSDLDTEDEFAERLAILLSDISTFAASRPLNVTYDMAEDELEDGIGLYIFEMTYQVSACA